MATPAHDKYYLKSLHQEIDLFDRKLAHLLKYDSFATDAERKASAGKLSAKRELLARTARQLANEGIEFKPSDLPRSFRTPEMAMEQQDVAVVIEDQAPVLQRAPAKRFPSPFAGTALDGATGLQEYKRTRTKTALKAQLAATGA